MGGIQLFIKRKQPNKIYTKFLPELKHSNFSNQNIESFGNRCDQGLKLDQRNKL